MKNFDLNKPAEGVGDIIAKITHRLGIAKVADKVAELLGKEDCGCERRRQELNDLLPFKNKTEEDADSKTDSREGLT